MLADIIGREADATMLRSRAAALRAALAEYTWDSAAHIFTNRAPNQGEFYKRISPTSFYPLMARAATDAQAAAAVRGWLLNPKHFAITAAGDFGNNTDDNYWGLPSIAASDPAFPALGYWRVRLRVCADMVSSSSPCGCCGCCGCCCCGGGGGGGGGFPFFLLVDERRYG